MEWQSGIDTIAHEATLEQKGKTIAVLGSGLNNIYPQENMLLYKNIIKKGGLIISEYSPNIKASSEKFLERNRIVSGISLGILVIEATFRSGTSVTAKLARKQNKKIFAIPHEISSTHGIGTNKLIQKGAILVTCAKDIIQEFDFIKFNVKVSNEQIKDTSQIINKKKVCTNEQYNEIYKHIGEEPCSIETIYKISNKSIGQINTILIMLELEGFIKKVAGGYKCVY